jgi:hypothetical protein
MSQKFENRSAFMFRMKLSNKPLFYPEDDGTVFCRYPMKYSMTESDNSRLESQISSGI